jgi:hypothetical protein
VEDKREGGQAFEHAGQNLKLLNILAGKKLP